MALQQSPELHEIFLRMYQALEAGDTDWVLEHMSREQGALSIGTDPSEWWDDPAVIARVYAQQLSELRTTGVHFQAGNPQCYQEGTVGWGADQARFVQSDGNEQPMRITAVFHREEDTWKIVQWHASLGIANVDALGTYLPT